MHNLKLTAYKLLSSLRNVAEIKFANFILKKILLVFPVFFAKLHYAQKNITFNFEILIFLPCLRESAFRQKKDMDIEF